MTLEDLKFKSRGDVLEAAEILGITADSEIPENCRTAALLLSCGGEFEERIPWTKIVKTYLEPLKNRKDFPFVTLLYTCTDPAVVIPGLPVLNFGGDMIESDAIVLESRTLHLKNIYQYFYHGQHFKAGNS